MKKLIVTTVALGVLLLAGGCSTIMCGSEKTINIRSQPPEAKFSIKDVKGIAITTGVTPTNVTLKRGRGWFQPGGYSVAFEKEGYQNTTVSIRQSVTGWYFGNILFGGLIGGLIIDPATGAMWDIEDVDIVLLKVGELEYPKATPNRYYRLGESGFKK